MAIPQELISMTEYNHEFEGNSEKYKTKKELERRQRNCAATKRARQKTNSLLQQKKAEYLREIEKNTKLKYHVHEEMKQLEHLLILLEQHKEVCPKFRSHQTTKTGVSNVTEDRPVYKTSGASHTTITVSAKEVCHTSINQPSAIDYPSEMRGSTPSCNTEPVSANMSFHDMPVTQTCYDSSLQTSNSDVQNQTCELTGSIQDTALLNYSLPIVCKEQNAPIPQSTTVEQDDMDLLTLLNETCTRIYNCTDMSHTEVTLPSDNVNLSQLDEICTSSTKDTTVAQQGESDIQTVLYALPLSSTTTSHATKQPTAQLSIPDFEVLKPTQVGEDREDHSLSKGMASKKTRQAKKKCKENSLDNDTHIPLIL